MVIIMGRCSAALVVLCLVLALCYGTTTHSPFDIWDYSEDIKEEVTSARPSNANNASYQLNNSGEMDVAEVLYNNIIQAAYSNAVKVTKNLHLNGQGSLIRGVALRLAREGNVNLLSYVYVLWSGGETDIFEQYMPDTLKMIFNGSVIIKQQKFGLALKLDANLDRDGDRIAWGDAHDQTSRRVFWNLVPLWEDNRVNFLIRNVDCNMNLKLELRPDSIGDRGAFGSVHSGVPFHAWILQPVMIGNEICFYIINVKYNQGLKLALAKDSYGDRKLWGHNGNVRSDPVHFAWSIYRPAVTIEPR